MHPPPPPGDASSGNKQRCVAGAAPRIFNYQLRSYLAPLKNKINYFFFKVPLATKKGCFDPREAPLLKTLHNFVKLGAMFFVFVDWLSPFSCCAWKFQLHPGMFS
nr:hypothetical protein [Morchella crassipes]